MISVIVPTCNRADHLQFCLLSLISQDFPQDKFEIIVVDDGSTDTTVEVVRKFVREVQVPEIKYVFQTRSGPGSARNRGISIAAGGILAFTEDDVVVDKGWMRNALPYFKDESVGVVEGLTLLEGREQLLRLPNLQRGFIPCNIFYRKEVIRQISGFDPQFYNPQHGLYFREDSDLGFRAIKAGWRLAFASEARVYHPRLFQRASDIPQFVRRYYFDPLLYRKHPRLYRKMIEVKKVGPFTVRRPFHWLCFTNILALLLLVIHPVYPIIMFSVSISVYLISLAGIGYKFLSPDFRLIQKNGFFRVLFQIIRTPFVYVYWLSKGSRHFRSWPWF